MTKVSDLTGAALDWAVATAVGYPVISPSAPWRNRHGAHGLAQVMVADTKRESACHYDFRPSESWGQGGPIIAQHRIELRRSGAENWYGDMVFPEGANRDDGCGYGPTALIAAMRCFVSSALGDEVEIPDELTTTVSRTL